MLLRSIPAIPLGTHTVPHKQTQSSSAPAATEFGIEGSPSSWSRGHGPSAPAEKHKDPRLLLELARNQRAKTQGEAREPQAPAGQLHLPKCQDRWFSHRRSRGACPGSCRSWKTQPRPLPGGRTAGTEPTLQSHRAAFTRGYNERILLPSPQRLRELKATLAPCALVCCLFLKLAIVLLDCYSYARCCVVIYNMYYT